MSTDAKEIEWQFDALDLGTVLRWLEQAPGRPFEQRAMRVQPVGTFNQVDLYLDTDDRRFHKAGYALRLRRRPRRKAVEATLKALAAERRGDGPQIRRELSEELAEADPVAVASSAGPVGERVRALAGPRRLHPLFEVRTRRRTFSLADGGSAAGELALDETAIRSPAGRPLARLRRVEVEVPETAVAAVEGFVDELRAACGLQPAGLTKYEAGLVATGPHRDTVESFGSAAIEPEDPIGRVALAVLRRHTAALVAKEPGTRLGEDVEELHDMRVASRRLRAALALFAHVLPVEAVRLRDELAWVGRTLGAVRDLDVQLEQLEDWIAAAPEADREPLASLRTLLVAQRAEARAAMLEALDSRRYETFLRRFGRMLRTSRGGRAGPARAPAKAAAPDLIERRHRAVRKAARRIGPGSPPGDYHRLRIACKRFRYALEFLADVYPGEAQRLIKRVVAVQDVLGLNQDADVAIARLRELAGGRGRELSPESVFAMGEVAERYRRSMEELQAKLPAAYARVEGKAWKTFRKVLEAERAAQPPVRARGPVGREAPGRASGPVEGVRGNRESPPAGAEDEQL